MPKKRTNEKLSFDLTNLQLIYDDLVECLEEDPDKNKDIIIERIREMTEFQLWGEKNNDTFFDFFCEHNVIDLMLRLLKKSTARDISIQIIQSLSMYLTNIKKPININYVLSNNAINEFITHSFNFADDETVDYYISFLKSLALRLEVIPLELFYNQRYKDFPIVSQAVKFYNYPASMVRTSVQNITLTLFKMDEKKLQNYFTNFPFISYFINLSCYLRDIWLKIDENLAESTIQSHSKMTELLDDQYDLLMYIDDVFQLQKEKINTALANCLIHYTIIPALLVPFTSSKRGMININLSLYLINLLLNSINHLDIVEFIVITLFSKKIDSSFLELTKTIPEEPVCYSKTWTFDSPWDIYQDVLSDKYLLYLESQDNSPSRRNSAQSPRKRSSPLLSAQKEGSLDTTQASVQEEAKEPIEIPGAEEEYKRLTRGTGVVADIWNKELEELTRFSPLNVLHQFQQKFNDIENESENNSDLVDNPISETFLSFLKSKDDNMILLMCTILNSTFNNRLISKKLLDICQLIIGKHDLLSQAQSEEADYEVLKEKNQTGLYILDCLYQLIIVDPPFRVITMRTITKLILDLSPHRKEKPLINPENLKIFNTGYKNAISKAMKYILNSITADFFVELFDIQWRNIYKKDFQKLEKKDYKYMLLPVIEEPVPGVDPYFRLPAGEYELAKREISVFLLFRKIRYTLVKSTKHSPQFIEDYNASIRKENDSNYWEEGKYYLIENRKLIPCEIEENNTKTLCYVVEDEENFLVIKPDSNRINWAQVLINTKLKSTEATENRMNENTLTVTIRQKEKYVDKNLIFSEQTLCRATKRTLEENRRYSKHCEINVLIKSFECAASDLIE